ARCLLGGLELQRHAVHAVALTGRLGSVGEHVTQVTAAARAVNFRAAREQAPVLARAYGPRQRLKEARPARAAVELAVRIKQRLAAARAAEGAGACFVIEGIAPGALGAMLAQHLVRLGRELSSPVGVRLLQRKLFVRGPG